MSNDKGGLASSEVATLAGAVLTSYLLASLVIGDLYPFSTFAMYSETPREPWASYVLAVDERSVDHNVSSFSGYRCDHAPDLRGPFCASGGDRRIDYIDAESERALSGGPAAGRVERVRIVRRGWDLTGSDRVVDCALATCEAGIR